MLKPFKGIVVGLTSLIFPFSVIAAQAAPYNIILIINDQETYRLATAPHYELPARATFQRHGITFRNHYTAAAMCSPSRATFLTGVPPQVNGVFDQMEYNFVPPLDPKRPNMGSILKSLGYRTVYFGKFEMSKTLLINVKDTVNYSTLAKPYGFDIFNPDGDVGGELQQGYQDDVYFVGEAVRWLHQNAANPKTNKQPFFMVISLLNPHDIMYADANLPNAPIVQKPAAPVILPPPANKIYEATWQFILPNTLQESLTAPGMPSALLAYQDGWSGALGFIPTENKDMWRYYYNYYLNALRDSDRNLQRIVDVLDDMQLWRNTVVIMTADHGEMGGAHGGLRGKGPMAYEENAHIPLIIDHPDAPQNVTCSALTSHLDLLPTLIGLTGLPQQTLNKARQGLPGHDFSNQLSHPETLDLHAIRPAILFNYVGISTIDAVYLRNKLYSSFTHQTVPPLTEVNLNNRGLMMFVFDGRYKFVRYYAPNQFNTPKTLKEIFANNDIQLFDLQSDPSETHNLALEAEKYQSVILRMNQLLNDLMQKEVGVNNGSFLPENVRPK